MLYIKLIAPLKRIKIANKIVWHWTD
jgi:hypothetical protein